VLGNERADPSACFVWQGITRVTGAMVVNFNGLFIPHTLVFWGSDKRGSADDENDPKKALGWHTGLLIKSLVLVVSGPRGKNTRTPLGLVNFDDGEIELIDAAKLHYKLDSFEMDKCRFRVLAAACQLNIALANVTTQPNPETQMHVLGPWRLEAKFSTHFPPQTQGDSISMVDWMETAENEIVEAYQKLGLIGTCPNALP
jgi:hypothetical protein